MKKTGIIALLVFVGALACAAGEPAAETQLGRVDFPNSGAPAAQEHFLRGVLWLHSFEYRDAMAEFRKAQELDPGFALAYWGEAMTHNHPLWSEQDRETARKALEKLAATPEARLAKAPTEREKGFLRAVEILYGEGEKYARDRAYAAAMRKLYEQFPDDLEVASFYALSELGSVSERDFAAYMRAAAVAEQVFARNPNHPGAAHYLIHSYDDPVHAPLGLRAARAYAKIAPAAVHALHMPSHIFLALGMWEDVTASNQASWEASVARGGASYHALHWLAYSYLQRGRYREARKLLERMESDAHANPAGYTGWHWSAMRAAYVVETRQWEEPVLRVELDTSGVREVAAPGADLFARGLAALKSGNRAGAEKRLAEMKSLRTGAEAAAETQAAHSHWAMQVSPAGLKTVAILEQELEALLKFADGHSAEAVRTLEEAAAAEEAMSFEFGPPAIVKPTRELLGEVLLEQGRPQEAQQSFERALARAPRR
ncbi:MAG: hypothetical protein ACRD4D_02730, partial [Candidatus Acidiferrales bacterium]